MVRNCTGRFQNAAVLILLILFPGLPALGQDTPTTDSSAVPQADDAQGNETPQVNSDDQQPPTVPREMPPEIVERMNAADEKFQQLQQQLTDAVVQMRTIHTHYLNDEVRTPAAKEEYYRQRNEAQRLMNEAFEVAMELIQYRNDLPAATYLVTMIKHRIERDIYDPATLQAGLMLMDTGTRMGVYVFLATARSAMAVGNVELAKKVYEAVEEEHYEDCDRALIHNADIIAEQWVKEQIVREREAKEDKLPRVKLLTTRGEVLIELYIDQAPSTVANFIKLVDDGFYDGLDFYQVVDHLLATTGDMSGNGSGNTGQFLADEHERDDARPAMYGSLVMLKMPIPKTSEFVPNTASCQFAILYLPLPALGKHQTVFGRVIEGMDAIGSLRRIDPTKKKAKNEIVVPPDRILSAEVVRRPETMPEIKYVQPAMPAPSR